MTPREFFDRVVQPNVAEFHAQFGNFRLAYNAVTSIDALAAHIYHWCVSNMSGEVAGLSRADDGYREHLTLQCPDFGLLRDIAKAQKHVHLTKGTPQVQAATQMSVRGIGYGQGGYGAGRYGGPPQVVVDKNIGGFEYVERLVDSVIDFLDQKLTTLGL